VAPRSIGVRPTSMATTAVTPNADDSAAGGTHHAARGPEHRDERPRNRVRRALLGLIARLHRWAESGSAGGAVCTWSCLQGSIVPGPSEALYLPLGLADPRRALHLAAWAALGAIAGGLIAYGIGAFALDSVGRPLLALFGVGPARWEQLSGLFHRHGAMLVLLSTVSPLSTKLVCIGAGAFGVPFWPYFAALALGRAGRFGVIGLIVRFAGDRLVARLEKRLGRSIDAVG
jgi:membrane protein YqaA with SNARE-associated domain